MQNDAELQATYPKLSASNLIRVTNSASHAQEESHVHANRTGFQATAIPQQSSNLEYLASIQHALRLQLEEEGHATIQLVFKEGERSRVNGLVISLLFPWLVLDEETDTLLLPDYTLQQYR